MEMRDGGCLNCNAVGRLARAVLICLLCTFALSAREEPGDWSGNFGPCDRHDELLKSGSMDLSVRFATSNRQLALALARAMDFWIRQKKSWVDPGSGSLASE